MTDLPAFDPNAEFVAALPIRYRGKALAKGAPIDKALAGDNNVARERVLRVMYENRRIAVSESAEAKAAAQAKADAEAEAEAKAKAEAEAAAQAEADRVAAEEAAKTKAAEEAEAEAKAKAEAERAAAEAAEKAKADDAAISDDQIAQMVAGSVEQLKGQLGGLNSLTLQRVRTAELAKDESDQRATAIQAIDAAIAKADATS